MLKSLIMLYWTVQLQVWNIYIKYEHFITNALGLLCNDLHKYLLCTTLGFCATF